jgi:hypothetical protein
LVCTRHLFVNKRLQRTVMLWQNPNNQVNTNRIESRVSVPCFRSCTFMLSFLSLSSVPFVNVALACVSCVVITYFVLVSVFSFCFSCILANCSSSLVVAELRIVHSFRFASLLPRLSSICSCLCLICVRLLELVFCCMHMNVQF